MPCFRANSKVEGTKYTSRCEAHPGRKLELWVTMYLASRVTALLAKAQSLKAVTCEATAKSDFDDKLSQHYAAGIHVYSE